MIKSEPSQSQNPQQSNVIMAETNACEELTDIMKVEDLDSILDNEGMDKLSTQIKLPSGTFLVPAYANYTIGKSI